MESVASLVFFEMPAGGIAHLVPDSPPPSPPPNLQHLPDVDFVTDDDEPTQQFGAPGFLPHPPLDSAQTYTLESPDPAPSTKIASLDEWSEVDHKYTVLGKRRREDIDGTSITDFPLRKFQVSFTDDWEARTRQSNTKRMKDLQGRRRGDGELKAPVGLMTPVEPLTVRKAERRKFGSSVAAQLHLDRNGDLHDQRNKQLVRRSVAQASPTARLLNALGRRSPRHDRKRKSNEGFSAVRIQRGRVSKGRYWSRAVEAAEAVKEKETKV